MPVKDKSDRFFSRIKKRIEENSGDEKSFKFQEQLEKLKFDENTVDLFQHCLLYTSPSPRDLSTSRMPSSA